MQLWGIENDRDIVSHRWGTGSFAVCCLRLGHLVGACLLSGPLFFLWRFKTLGKQTVVP